MLKQGEVSNLIRKKCGIQEANDKSFFSREEQLVILAHVIKQEEIIKEAKLNEELIQTVTDRVMKNLKVTEDINEEE